MSAACACALACALACVSARLATQLSFFLPSVLFHRSPSKSQYRTVRLSPQVLRSHHGSGGERCWPSTGGPCHWRCRLQGEPLAVRRGGEFFLDVRIERRNAFPETLSRFRSLGQKRKLDSCAKSKSGQPPFKFTVLLRCRCG